MVFNSSVISLEWNRNNVILKRGQSTLLISPEHVQALRLQDTEAEFKEYFLTKALQNREARRVFEAWVKKEASLLDKIYQEMKA